MDDETRDTLEEEVCRPPQSSKCSNTLVTGIAGEHTTATLACSCIHAMSHFPLEKDHSPQPALQLPLQPVRCGTGTLLLYPAKRNAEVGAELHPESRRRGYPLGTAELKATSPTQASDREDYTPVSHKPLSPWASDAGRQNCIF